MNKYILISVFLLLSLSGFAQRVKPTTETPSEYQLRVRQALALDYSMPDYSVTKIDSKAMGPRLAAILTSLGQNYSQSIYQTTINNIQASQIEGLRYVSVIKMTLTKVTKVDNKITVTYRTTLDANQLKLKESQLTFTLVDGMSADKDVNELLCNLCRYL